MGLDSKVSRDFVVEESFQTRYRRDPLGAEVFTYSTSKEEEDHCFTVRTLSLYAHNGSLVYRIVYDREY